MTLPEIIQDIHGLESELAQLEKRYGLLSADFYHLYKAGELEQTRDFIQWIGYYEAKLKREAQYRCHTRALYATSPHCTDGTARG
jgi:hypothetical protein